MRFIEVVSKRGSIAIAIALFVALCAATVQAQPIELLSAKRLAVGGGGGEISTTLAPAPGGAGGLTIDTETVKSAGDANVFLITFSGTGDSHNGAQLDLACKVDGNLCETISEVVPVTPSGWVSVQRYFDPDPAPGFNGDGGGGPADWHDNNVNQTWCVAVDHTPANIHTVEIKIGANGSPFIVSSPGPRQVFVDNVKIYIEAAKVSPENAANGGACGIKTVIP